LAQSYDFVSMGVFLATRGGRVILRVAMTGFVKSIPDWFDTRKAAQVVAFFAGKAGAP
jgi:hypothetical protein